MNIKVLIISFSFFCNNFINSMTSVKISDKKIKKIETVIDVIKQIYEIKASNLKLNINDPKIQNKIQKTINKFFVKKAVVMDLETIFYLFENGYVKDVDAQVRVNRIPTNALFETTFVAGDDPKAINVVNFLIKKGAKVNNIFIMLTPLDNAVRNQNIPIIEKLLDSGADVNLGSTLWYAVINFYNQDKEIQKRIITILINRGANINQLNGLKNKKGYEEVIKFVQEEFDKMKDFEAKYVNSSTCLIA